MSNQSLKEQIKGAINKHSEFLSGLNPESEELTEDQASSAQVILNEIENLLMTGTVHIEGGDYTLAQLNEMIGPVMLLVEATVQLKEMLKERSNQ